MKDESGSEVAEDFGDEFFGAADVGYGDAACVRFGGGVGEAGFFCDEGDGAGGADAGGA